MSRAKDDNKVKCTVGLQLKRNNLTIILQYLSLASDHWLSACPSIDRLQSALNGEPTHRSNMSIVIQIRTTTVDAGDVLHYLCAHAANIIIN